MLENIFQKYNTHMVWKTVLAAKLKFNLNLLLAIERSGFSLEDIASLAGIYEHVLVTLIQKNLRPDRELQVRLAFILGKPSEELWPVED